MSAIDQRARDLFQSLPMEQKKKALAIMRSLIEKQDRHKQNRDAPPQGIAQDRAS